MKTMILLLVLFLGGCAFNVNYPQNDEAAKWVAYYHEQFIAFGYNVVPPDGSTAEVQRQAYMQVKTQYDSYHLDVKLAVATLCVGVLLLVGETVGK